jgi:D-threonate/D-erythronate kinase
VGGTAGQRGDCVRKMILTLADDLSGAAEAGGIALRFGLAAEVQTEFFPARDVDLIVRDTDSRTCSATDASR